MENKKYTYVLVDLDGTISDSGEGVAHAIEYALSQVGIEEKDKSKLYRFVGPPILEALKQYYHLSEKRGMQAVS